MPPVVVPVNGSNEGTGEEDNGLAHQLAGIGVDHGFDRVFPVRLVGDGME